MNVLSIPVLWLALLFVLPCAFSSGAASEEKLGSRASFNTGWLFARFGPMPDGSTLQEPASLQAPGLQDAQWRKLDLPHDWGIEGPFRQDLPGGTGKLPWTGIGWYRKHFRASADDKAMRLFIDFDGAMSHAKVWLNGHYLGEWPYGYSSFRFELTPHLRFDRDNVLAVRLENPPGFSRWYPGGGLYRNVWLVRTAPVHIAHWGTFITTPQVTESSCTVRVRTVIDNQSSSSKNVTVQIDISEHGSSAKVAEAPRGNTDLIAPGASATHQTDIRVPSPHLWDVAAPHLYYARTTIRQDGRIVDTALTVFGIRTVDFTADNGLLLNGKRVPINGVCNHHDLGIIGTAVNRRALERQIQLLQEMGCNAIRTSHNPPAPELLDLCDRLGMVVLDEAFDSWIKGKVPNDYSTLFKEWHERDIRALVRRDRNHPSVIAWSAGNEIWEQENGDLVGQLRAIFRSEDPTRPVTAACNGAEAGFNGFQNAVDIFGYNYKPHLYRRFREANPTKPLFGSETASCVSSYSEYLFPVSDDKSKGFFDYQVSSYDLYAPPWATPPDLEFAAQDSNPFVGGEFVWTGFDYLGEPTPWEVEGSPSRSSYFGIMDLCGFRKDRFYLYQARWRPDLPMAHILPHWNWPGREGKITPVHVYTSGDEAELFLNGTSLGRRTRGPFEYRLRWDDVIYAPGALTVVAYKNGRAWARDTMTTTGTPARLELSFDRSVVVADGHDLAFVTVQVVDQEGRRVPSAMNEIRFRVTGAGTLAAVGNGDPTDQRSFQSDRCKAFHGQCLAILRTRGDHGEIRLEAMAEDLPNATALIMAK